uniref:Patellin-3-like n=1 Tax=Davidia involucrata TaxID=16924 RepID=A0A5B7BG24_DAVIN
MSDQEVQKTAQPVVADVLQAEKPTAVGENEAPPVSETEEDPDTVKSKPAVSKSTDDEKMPQSVSFKEESSRVADLPDFEKKALEELKHLVQQALNNHEFTALMPSPVPPEEDQEPPVTTDQVPPAPSGAPPPVVLDEPAKPEPETKKDKNDDDEVVLEPPQQPATTEPVVVTAELVIEENNFATTTAVDIDDDDEDGAKTVEAIEETIVAVSTTTSLVPSDDQLQPPPPEKVFIWGIKLLEDERSDVMLLKFLRARDFKVKEAFTMIKNTVRWRKDFGIDKLLEEEEDLGVGHVLEKVVFMHGYSKEGHPVCYNVYGQFQNKELYHKTFSDQEKRQKFLRWRIQFLEKSIRNLDFSPGGISTIVQVNDLKNSPGPAKWELRQATKLALQLLQDNYPEFLAKQVFINVPWWYLAVNRMISPFLTQRTKSKFVFAGPSKSNETLLKYVAAEKVPVQYGGLSKDGNFGTADAVTEITVKPSAKHTVEFPVAETCLLTWEVRVVGWDVSYGAEFVPSAEEGYTVIIHKARKVASTEEPVICSSFKIGEPGKVVLTIDNPTSKKKKLLYRLKAKSSTD